MKPQVERSRRRAAHAAHVRGQAPMMADSAPVAVVEGAAGGPGHGATGERSRCRC
ncbi:hypothetical protein ACU4GD_23660 [Cupriavidus basilensis]